MVSGKARVESVCVYCGSSNAARPEFLQQAASLGRALADASMELVYGGGGIGLMGACARAAHEAGGKVLGIMPNFLRAKEILYDEVETIVVPNMHQRKQLMFERSDAFVVLPGGVGTLEEIVELLSWKRLGLHDKPVVFVDIDGFWKPFFDLINHTITERLTPGSFAQAWYAVGSAEEVVPLLQSLVTDDEPNEMAAVILT